MAEAGAAGGRDAPSADRIANPWGARTPYARGEQWPARVDLECDICWTLVGQAAQGARDRDLSEVVERCEGETAIKMKWLETRMKQAAPQALVVAR